jgi:DUF1680 family protein
VPQTPITTGVIRDLGRGPVDLSTSTQAAIVPLAFGAIELEPTGFCGAWQELNRSATLQHCIDNLESTGTLDNVRRLIGLSGAEYRGMVFQDSDIYKTLEAASWELGRAENTAFREFLDTTALLLAQAQDDDGYLNSWFQGVKPEQRWQDLRSGHEMYCAGHLIQAAVAAARVAGHTRLLHVARRFADLLLRRFGESGQAAVCGHPEIETALVELSRVTGQPAYGQLARRMIEQRGHGLLGDSVFGRNYYQDHLPVREAVEATGHAVRQLYLAAGVTDLYLEEGDASLLQAMEMLWQDAFNKKTYLTGGHGSRHRAESFGDAYELPPDRAYAETCAAIASFQWNWRLLLATGQGRYADEMERALYNAIAVAVAADGRHFFYSNPLQLRPGHDGSTEDAPSERLGWYACACCPPNLARLVASLHHYMATQDADGIQLHLFSAGRLRVEGQSGAVELSIQTAYPWDGQIAINLLGTPRRDPWTLSVRLPAWCDSATVQVNGSERKARADARGYLRLTDSWSEGTSIAIDLPMPTRLVRAHPHVDAVRGCGALMRGPLVYCVEACDVAGSVSIDDIALRPDRLPEPATDEAWAPAPVVLRGEVSVAQPAREQPLYSASNSAAEPAANTEASVAAIPYFRWANRGAGAMRVWLPVDTSRPL